MKDWISYIKESWGSDLWGFVVLDYYYTKKAEGDKENPSHFIDQLLSHMLKEEIDPVAVHNVLLSVCIHLFGSSFSDIMEKSINLLKNIKKPLTKEQLESILSHYDVYRKREVFIEKIKASKLHIPGNSEKYEMVKNEGGQMETIDLFYSYSHDDEKLRNKLEKHLSLLKRGGFIVEWHDRKILAGSNVNDQIDDNIKKAKIILLLVSASFLASDYCFGKEMTYALERHKKGEAKVIPIILRECDWKTAPFKDLLALPTDGKPVASRKWKTQDEAFANIAAGIRKVVKEIIGK